MFPRVPDGATFALSSEYTARSFPPHDPRPWPSPLPRSFLNVRPHRRGIWISSASSPTSHAEPSPKHRQPHTPQVHRPNQYHLRGRHHPQNPHNSHKHKKHPPWLPLRPTSPSLHPTSPRQHARRACPAQSTSSTAPTRPPTWRPTAAPTTASG